MNDYTQVISICSLEYTTFIVEVGALTFGTDDKGIVIESKQYPMQFSKKAVKEMLIQIIKESIKGLKIFL